MYDPERQALLCAGNSEARTRRYRALSYEEVQTAREDVHWRRGRCLLVFLFWGIMAMCLSMIACILVTAPNCNRSIDSKNIPAVPPVHMTLAPLISQGKAVNDLHEFYSL